MQLIHGSKTRIYGELIADGRAPLRPGVARLIGEARAAGLRWGIASTTTSANVSALIGAQFGADAWNWFEALACGDVVAHKKPAPDIYTRLAGHAAPAGGSLRRLRGLGQRPEIGQGGRAVHGGHAHPWSAGQDFGGADLVLRGLGDADAPLAASDAGLAGGPYLTLERLQQLHAAATRPAAA